MASIERRLHEAVRERRLTFDELLELVYRDDAMLTRIANAAAADVGLPEPGAANELIFDMSWRQLGLSAEEA